jgi:hypothetical protein
VGEDLLVTRTQFTHNSLVCLADMTVQVRPAKARNIAFRIRAVVAQNGHGIFADRLIGELDAECGICDGNVRVCVFGVLSFGLGEDDEVRVGLC